MKERIDDRVKRHLKPGITYYELMRLVFPEDEYPRAWRGAAKGGPSGCAMAFGASLRRLNLTRDYSNRSVIVSYGQR